MSKIVIIGSGAMGSAFAFPCLDNNHDTNIIGTHLEDEFIDELKNNNNLHPALKIKIPKSINISKFEKFDTILKSKIDLLVLGISSKGIEWVAEQLYKIYKNNELPSLLMLTKGLSIYNNKYELLVAVLLSAQCTDQRVNQVTPILFKKANTAIKMTKVSKNTIYKKMIKKFKTSS